MEYIRFEDSVTGRTNTVATKGNEVRVVTKYASAAPHMVRMSAKEARKVAFALLEAATSLEPAPAPKLKTISYAMLTPLAKKVYQHMKRAGSISAREAMADYGITSASLARRICDLEGAGIKVERDRREHPVTRQLYTRYSLAA